MEVERLREIAARFHRILDIVLDEDFSAPSGWQTPLLLDVSSQVVRCHGCPGAWNYKSYGAFVNSRLRLKHSAFVIAPLDLNSESTQIQYLSAV